MTKNSFMIPMLAGLAFVGGIGLSYAGLASAQATTTSTNTPSSIIEKVKQHLGMHAPAGNDGVITSINGGTVIMQEEADEGGASYTVDASGATVTKDGTAGTLGSLTVGDKIFVKGTVTGTNVVATAIADGHGGHMKGGFHGENGKNGNDDKNDNDYKNGQGEKAN
jgi:hypothetical protein